MKGKNKNLQTKVYKIPFELVAPIGFFDKKRSKEIHKSKKLFKKFKNSRLGKKWRE